MIQHSSDSNEHYTDTPILDLVREVMGGIDLDPASCELAQTKVEAQAWYGPGSPCGEDGLKEPWLGRVYLNPPGGVLSKEECKETPYKTTSRTAIWWAKLAEAWKTGEVEQAIFMGFSLEVLRTVQQLDVLQPVQFPFCIPSERLSFGTFNREYTKGRKKGQLIAPDQEPGTWALQSSPALPSVIVYLPPSITDTSPCLGTLQPKAILKFDEVFNGLGQVRV